MSFVALGRGEHKNVRSQESYPSFHPLWSWHWKGWRDVHEDNEHHLAPMHRNSQLDGDQAWFFRFGSWADNYGNFDLWKPKTFSLACNLFSLLTDGEWFGQIPRLLVILTIENLCFLLHVFFSFRLQQLKDMSGIRHFHPPIKRAAVARRGHPVHSSKGRYCFDCDFKNQEVSGWRF